jgi:hypothetical protein
MRQFGDRRSQVRFEVVGALWGVLELTETARIVNISTSGALIESAQPAPLETTQAVRISVDGEDVVVDARVRHVRRITRDDKPSYLIGVEFVSTPVPLLHSIDHLAANADGT